MRVVIADSRFDVIERVIDMNSETGLSTLVSYWYCVTKGKSTSLAKKIKQKMLEETRKKNYKIYLDSGVFSARKSGTVIPVEDLIDFYKDNSISYDHVFNMDEGEHEEQLQNCIKMKVAGVPVIGIFHADMTLDMLHRYIDICEGYIAVSFFKTGSPKTEKSRQNLDRVFNSIIKTYSTNDLKRVHGLGVEVRDLLLRYPFYSVDSTSAKSNYAFGKIAEFDSKKGTIIAHKAINKEHALRIMQKTGAASAAGFAHDSHSITERVRIAVEEREKYNRFLNDVWKNRGIIWQN